MWSYLLKRIGLSAAIVLSALLALFLLLHLIPGDPATIALGPRATPEVVARYAERAHLNEPVLVQFWIYLTNALSGDLGLDVFSQRSVTKIVLEGLPSTLILAVTGLCGRLLSAFRSAAYRPYGPIAGSTGSPESFRFRRSPFPPSWWRSGHFWYSR